MTLDLDKLTQLARAATPGHEISFTLTDEPMAQYIAALNPETCLELISELRQLRKRIRELERNHQLAENEVTVLGERARELAGLIIERDRYRAALEAIKAALADQFIATDRKIYLTAPATRMVLDIAEQALAGEGEQV
jgi:hypothetical protein